MTVHPNDMQQAALPVLSESANSEGVVFVPGGRFFVRRVPLSPEGDNAMQVELALEGFSPFPAAQLYYGFRTNTPGTEALIFAAYRRNFSAEEMSSWAGASAVLPAFSVWLGMGAAGIPLAVISLRELEDELEAVAWDGKSELPAAILVRKKDGLGEDDLVAEARTKAGIGPNVQVKVFKSLVEVARENRDLILRLGSSGVATHFGVEALGRADIRDKEVLVARRKTLRRDTLLWRGFSAVLLGLAACIVLELGATAARFWLTRKQSALNERIPAVRKIEQAQGMATRLEEISTQRVLPFEMLNALNNKRPAGVEFDSVTTKGLWQMDIRGQANTADEALAYETDLRNLDEIQKVEVLEKRNSDGATVFHYEITFNPGWYRMGGGG